MKKTALLLVFLIFLAFGFSRTVSAQPAIEDNPIFTSSLKWLENPIPCENSTATNENEMRAYEDVIPAPAPYGDRKFKMVPIPGGKFKMGSPEKEKGRQETEGPQHEVEVKPFWIGEAEVTWREFELYALKYLRNTHLTHYPANRNRFRQVDALAAPTYPYDIAAISYKRAGVEGLYPASGMTQFTAQMYCKWLTAVTGRYYRLPTEAEWEFACRAGTTTPFSFGEEDTNIDDYAWTAKNCEPGTGYHPVKHKKPNAFGLYDMHGNVAEWTCQQYRKGDYADYAAGKVEGGFISSSQRTKFGIRRSRKFDGVVRGGSCDHTPAECRSATRLVSVRAWHSQDPHFPIGIWWLTDAPYVGFRVVRPLEVPKTEDEAALYDPNPTVWEDYIEMNQRM